MFIQMNKFNWILFLFIFPAMLIGLMPLAGVFFSGRSIIPYIEFPPKPMVLSHAPFSLAVFLLILLFVIVVLAPFIIQGIQYPHKKRLSRKAVPFPWWGYASVLSLLCFWSLAWTRFDGFNAVQHHTFFPLWLSWIFCVNALIHRKTGSCPLTRMPFRFLCLFQVSAVFWWVFEYLNRFVGNWVYTGSQYPPWTYFFLATLSFSTVLPAVESMKSYLLTFNFFKNAFHTMKRFSLFESKVFALFLLFVSCLSLFMIATLPDPLFFTIWISPLFIFVSFRVLFNQSHILSGIQKGNFTLIITYAAAALICGFFWEMFNIYSLAKWHYSIPYVQVLHLFEMPILGYAGYLPFGLECALIIDLITKDSSQ